MIPQVSVLLQGPNYQHNFEECLGYPYTNNSKLPYKLSWLLRLKETTSKINIRQIALNIPEKMKSRTRTLGLLGPTISATYPSIS